MLGDWQQNKNNSSNDVDNKNSNTGNRISSTSDENDSCLPCFGLPMRNLKSSSSMKGYCYSFIQKKNDKKDDERKRKKVGDLRIRGKSNEGARGLFGRKKVAVGSDSGNDSDGDDLLRPQGGNRYSDQRDGQRRFNDVNGNNNRDNKGRNGHDSRGQNGVNDKNKHKDENFDDYNQMLKRDPHSGQGKDIESFLINRRDILSGREDDSEASHTPVLRKSERVVKGNKQKESDFHERNKSYSVMDRKMNEKHQRTNSSMI